MSTFPHSFILNNTDMGVYAIKTITDRQSGVSNTRQLFHTITVLFSTIVHFNNMPTQPKRPVYSSETVV